MVILKISGFETFSAQVKAELCQAYIFLAFSVIPVTVKVLSLDTLFSSYTWVSW
jgi:hypothetical protein